MSELVPLGRGTSWQRRFVGTGSPTTQMIKGAQRGLVPAAIALTATTALLTFPKDISGGDLTGFAVTIDGTPDAVISAANVLTNDILLTWTSTLLAGELLKITYSPGAWVGDSGRLVPAFGRESGL